MSYSKRNRLRSSATSPSLFAVTSSTIVSLLLLGCGGVSGADDAPSIESLAPDRGSSLGGTLVTVTGAGFESASDHYVVVGGLLATEVTVLSETSLSFVSPPGLPGTADVSVANFGGSTTMLSSFAFNDQPQLFDIDRTVLRGGGGQSITLRGVGFANNVVGETSVQIGASIAASVTVVDDTTITATTAPRASTDPGFRPLNVAVSNANGISTLTGEASYTRPGLLFAKAIEETKLGLFDPTDGFVDVDVVTGATSLRKATVLSDGRIVSNSANQWLELQDLETNQTTAVARLTPAGRVNSLTGDDDGNLWFLTSGVLASVDLTTAAVTVAGTIDAAATTGRNCILNRDATTVFYVGDTANGLYAMSKADSSLTPITAFSGLPTSATTQHCKALAFFDGELYAVLYDRDSAPNTMIAVHVDPTTGVVTEIDRYEGRMRAMFATPNGF